jgi:hypothetical protein
MKFAALVKGTADVRPVEFMLPGHENPIVIGQRPLSAWEEKEVIDRALLMFDPKGQSKPDADDPRYVMAIWAHTLLLACQCMDGDDKGQPFFSDANEILQGLDRDRVSYLYEKQQCIQEDHGMRKERLSADEMMAAVHELVTKEVGDSTLPFWKWGPSARASFMHFLASALYHSAPVKSHYGLTSDNVAPNASPTQSPE